MPNELDPTEQEERTAYPQLCALLSDTLRELKAQVSFVHAKADAPTNETKAQYAWCVALGVLTYDIAGSITVLLASDRTRAGKILGRSLFEYQLRLEVYKNDPTEALADREKASRELRRFLDGRPTGDLQPFDLSPEAIADLERFMNEHAGKVRARNVWEDIRRNNAGNDRQALFEYLNLYGYPSALAHGNGLIFYDVIRWDGSINRLAWRSEYLTRFLGLIESTTRTIRILELIEQTAGLPNTHAAYWNRYGFIMRPYAERFRAVVQRRTEGKPDSSGAQP